jgi:tetratricopeptide (TPR) repeat protein
MMKGIGRFFLLMLLVSAVSSVRVRGEGAPSQDELLLADGLFARGFYDMALTEYERLLERYPAFDGRDALLFRAAESARRHDRPTLARRLYEEILDGPGTGDFVPRARLRLADLAFEAEAYSAARRHAAALLVLNPPPDLAAAALHTLAETAEQLGDAEESRIRRTQLLREHPQDPHAAYAAMHLAMSEPRQNVQERREWFRAALRNPPSRDLEVEALWGLGMLELDEGNAAEAAHALDQLRAAHPDHPRVQTGILTIAWSLMMADRYAEALEVAADAPARRRAEHPDSWLYLEAVSLRGTGRDEESYSKFRQLLDDFPGSRFRTRSAFDLALMYAEREEHEGVIALSGELMAFPERREDALWLLAESFRGLGRTEEALQRYEELAGLRPSTARTRDAAFQRALLLRRTDPAEAAGALMDFAVANPEDSRAFSSLRAAGGLWMEQGQVSAARRAWRSALELYPEDPNRHEVGFSLAMMELREGDVNEARRLFERILSDDSEGPRRARAAYWIAVLADDRGDDRAGELLRSALAREQSADHQRNLRLRLARLLEAQGDLEAAESEYRTLLEEPNAPGLSDMRLGWMLRRVRERRDHEAMLRIAEVMTEAHRSDMTRETGYYARAEVFKARGQLEEAVPAWRAGLQLEGRSRQAAAAAYGLGRAYMLMEEPDSSEDSFRKALQLAAGLEDARYQAMAMMGLGDLFSLRGDWNEAARMYMGLAVLFDDPELTPAALTQAAEAFTRAGRDTEAERALRERKTRFPEFTQEP